MTVQLFEAICLIFFFFLVDFQVKNLTYVHFVISCSHLRCSYPLNDCCFVVFFVVVLFFKLWSK